MSKNSSIKMSNIIKCYCGMMDAVTPKNGESKEQFIARRKCRNCRRQGQWRWLTYDEWVWH